MRHKGPEERVCSLLKNKLSVLHRYLSITRKMKKAIKGERERELKSLLSERQSCIRIIDKIDARLVMLVRTGRKGPPCIPQGNGLNESDRGPWKSKKIEGLIESTLSHITSTIESIALMDKELALSLVRKSDEIKRDIIRIQERQKAASGYRVDRINTPRFLDERS